jgi:hypothetical protein
MQGRSLSGFVVMCIKIQARRIPVLKIRGFYAYNMKSHFPILIQQTAIPENIEFR